MNAVSRRNLIKGAALGTAAVSAMGAVSAWASEAPAEPAWDAEYDVVVLGLGGAGANAAVAAYEEGAKVLVCEKAPEGQEPCNTKASGQFVIATDDADQLYSYFVQLMGKFKNWDEEALRAMCEGAAGNWNWAVDVLGMDPDVACPAEVEGDRVGPCTCPQRRRLGHGPRRLHAAVERVPRARGQRPLLQHPGGRQDL